jgi:hypothetical protein
MDNDSHGREVGHRGSFLLLEYDDDPEIEISDARQMRDACDLRSPE